MKMERISIGFCLALALAAPAALAAEGSGAIALGSKAPMAATKMKNVDGKMVSIADVTGRPARW